MQKYKLNSDCKFFLPPKPHISQIDRQTTLTFPSSSNNPNLLQTRPDSAVFSLCILYFLSILSTNMG